ncbi:MAG TPA: hypothetical protein PKG52_09100 [bacterium]|nr:hypothetical protein [bacterium]HPS30523.1 hypothetical protein [bacterium]
MYKLMLMTVTILAANLMSGFISNAVLNYYRLNFSPKIATMIGMAAIVLVLYPMYRYLNSWMSAISKKLVKAGRKLIGPKIGALIMFTILLVSLYFGYLKLWFSK